MNKGIMIRNNKLKHKAKKAHSVKPGQENICRFIVLKNQLTGFVNCRRTYLGTQIIEGLQIKNKLYYIKDDVVHFCFINKKNTKILKKFTDVPTWATQPLIEKYNTFYSQTSGASVSSTSDTTLL